MSSFYVENFGCRATQADGAAIEKQFRDQGLSRADASTRADYVVLNTCAVTAAAEQDARAAIRRLRRQNPDCQIVITGCYAQRAPEEVAALPGVARVVGNSHKHALAKIALAPMREGIRSGTFFPVSELGGISTDGSLGTAEMFVSDIFAHTELMAAPVFDSANERTRPNLKIQDGCNNRCSFCIIPSLRGSSRSLAVEDVMREVNQLVAAGYREVVLSGINLGRWGRDFAPVLRDVRTAAARFDDLLRAILEQTSIEKLRISSVEPMDWSDSLIRMVAESPRIAKHAHVPMQSGSDSVLRRMHRKYRPWHYREKIEKIRATMPTSAIGADVMVGFPGETDAEFEETRRMIEDLPFTYLHVFTFSARPGTPAAAMANQVPVRVARDRNQVLRELAAEKKQAFMRSFAGKTIEAITLGTQEPRLEGALGRARLPLVPVEPSGSSLGAAGSRPVPDGAILTSALTDNYLKLRLSGNHAPNQWLQARITGTEGGELVGRPESAGRNAA